LSTNNSRADFFTVYRKESDEFDTEYTMECGSDSNTPLIYVSRLVFVPSTVFFCVYLIIVLRRHAYVAHYTL